MVLRATGSPANVTTYFCYEGTLVALNALMFKACQAGLEPIGGVVLSRVTLPPGATQLYLQTFVGYAPFWRGDQAEVTDIFEE